MSEYTSLPDKYRPKTWEEVVGHASEITRLKGMIKSGKIPHCILFTGPTGVGKTTLAKIFASYVNGKKGKPGELDPMNFTEVNGASSRGIDEMRALVEEASFMPSSGKYRFIFLDEAQDLTSAAAKSLLIPTEKPPAHTIYIFSSMEPDKLLPALVGRCSTIELKLPTREEVASRIKSVAKEEGIKYIDSESALLIAEASGGHVRNALGNLQDVIQFVDGAEDEDADIKKLVRKAIKQTSNIADDLVAIKTLLSIYVGSASSVHNSILDANDFNGLIQKITYLNMFILDYIFAPQHPKVWYTSANKKLIAALQEKVGDVKALGQQAVMVQQSINQVKMDMGTFLATDRAVFSARLVSLAYQIKRERKEK